MKRRVKFTVYFYIMGFIGALLIFYVVWFYAKQHRFIKYKSPKYGFSLSYPANWSIVENRPGVAAIFKTPLDGDLDRFAENIVMEIKPAIDISLEQYTEAVVKELKKSFGNFIDVKEKTMIRMLGGKGMRLVFIGINPDHENRKMLLQWTIKDNRIYQLIYMAESNDYDKYEGKAKRLMGSLKLD